MMCVMRENLAGQEVELGRKMQRLVVVYVSEMKAPWLSPPVTRCTGTEMVGLRGDTEDSDEQPDG